MLAQHDNKFAMNESKTWSTPDTISYSAAISACKKGVGTTQIDQKLLNRFGETA